MRLRRGRARRRGRGSAASTGTTWMRSQSSRSARRSSRRGRGRSSTSRSTSHERLGERERRGAPVAVGRHGGRATTSPGRAAEVAGDERGGVEGERHSAADLVRGRGRGGRRPTAATCARRARAGRRAGPARAGRGRRGRRSSARRRVGSSGPSWATARPPTVTTIRSPASARRTSGGQIALRSSRIPTCSTVEAYTCVHAPKWQPRRPGGTMHDRTAATRSRGRHP